LALLSIAYQQGPSIHIVTYTQTYCYHL